MNNYYKDKFFILVFLVNFSFSINKENISGLITNLDGHPLFDVSIKTLKQNKNATTNRFGEFDLGKILTNDSIEIECKGYQNKRVPIFPYIEVSLFDKLKLQIEINNSNPGDTIHFDDSIEFYPTFIENPNVGISIIGKSDITIIGNPKHSLKLNWNNSDLIHIINSKNIVIQNLNISYSAINNTNLETSGVRITNSDNILISKSNFYCNGSIGIKIDSSKNITIQNSIILNNIKYGVSVNNSKNIIISDNTSINNGSLLFNSGSLVVNRNNIIKIKNYFVPEFVFVKGGTIEILDEEVIPPPLPIKLSSGDIFISKTEITFKQYDDFCKSTKNILPDDSEWGRGNRPIINITKNDAIKYCKWLSNVLQKKVRLPNSNEWEFGARGGLIGGDNSIYSGSNNIKKVAWCKYTSKGKTNEVAGLIPNELGLFDFTGNVYEFCSDTKDSMNIARGGSWVNSSIGCRIEDKVFFSNNFWDDNIGFRVVHD